MDTHFSKKGNLCNQCVTVRQFTVHHSPLQGIKFHILNCCGTFFECLKGAVSRGIFTIFEQIQPTIRLLIYKIILKHKEKEINQVLKEDQVMVCSSPFWKQKCENLKKIRLIFFKFNSLRSNQFMTRDIYQQFWYTGVVLTAKLDHYFMVDVNPKTFLAFWNNTNFPWHCPFNFQDCFSIAKLLKITVGLAKISSIYIYFPEISQKRNWHMTSRALTGTE